MQKPLASEESRLSRVVISFRGNFAAAICPAGTKRRPPTVSPLFLSHSSEYSALLFLYTGQLSGQR